MNVRPVYFALLLLMFLAPAAAPAAAQPATAPLTAYVSRNGSVTIRRAGSARVIASVAPGLFQTGWQQRGVGPTGTVENGAMVAAIRAYEGKSVVRVKGTVRAEGNVLRLRYEMTPESALRVNSAHVSVNVPVGPWVGAKWALGETAGTVPARADKSSLGAGAASRLSLTRGGARVQVTADAPQPMLLQDNRVFSGGELEIRLGRQTGEGRDWAAGETETVAFTLDLGAPMTVEREEPMVLRAGTDWVPVDLKLDVAPGSALDFSFLADAPAGKHGRVVVRPDGHFGFERGKRPARFYGVNLCFSANYLEKAEADRLALRLRRVGYNAVRIHHFEGDLVDQSAKNSVTLRADNLDKLDYLVAALKKQGIYLKTDLYVSRPVKPEEMQNMNNFKMAVLVSDEALANWKTFARSLLTHVNPYTKRAYKDEPALAWLSVMNEGAALNYLSDMNPALRAAFQREWEAWLRARYGTEAKLKTAWALPDAVFTAALPNQADQTARGRDVGAFVTHLHERAHGRMRDFLRREIGTKALLTDLNGWSETPGFMAVRTRLDWVDNHFYWDHPQFLEREWSLPSRGGSGGAGAVEAGGVGPNVHAMTRLVGKPFSISEYNYSAPNPYRAEGGLIMGAAAALQDWDAVWRFAYSHSRDTVLRPGALNYFDMATDPAGQASERAALLFYLRGDVRPAAASVTLSRSRAALAGGADLPSSNLGDLTLVARVGTRVHDQAARATDALRVSGVSADLAIAKGASQSAVALQALRRSGALPARNRTDAAKGVKESATGELFLDSEQGLLRVNTPRSVGGVAPAGRTIQCGPLTARVQGTRAAVWASSLDGRPVAAAKRLLLVHLTDVQNTGMRYAGGDRRVLEAWGGLPHLARVGAAQVTLTHQTPARLKAWRLDTAGNRVAAVPVRVLGKQAVLDLSTRGKNGATLYYEVATQ